MGIADGYSSSKTCLESRSKDDYSLHFRSCLDFERYVRMLQTFIRTWRASVRWQLSWCKEPRAYAWKDFLIPLLSCAGSMTVESLVFPILESYPAFGKLHLPSALLLFWSLLPRSGALCWEFNGWTSACDLHFSRLYSTRIQTYSSRMPNIGWWLCMWSYHFWKRACVKTNCDSMYFQVLWKVGHDGRCCLFWVSAVFPRIYYAMYLLDHLDDGLLVRHRARLQVIKISRILIAST